MSTRAGIFRRAVHLAQKRGKSTADGVSALTATGGDGSTTLIDTANLPPPPASTSLYQNKWIYCPALAAADRVRIGNTYTAATQTITIASGLDWDTGPSSDTVYYWLKDDPDIWNAAINEALRELLTSGGRTMAQGALAYIWALDPRMIPIPGFKTVEQVQENAGAMEFGPLGDDAVRRVHQIVADLLTSLG